MPLDVTSLFEVLRMLSDAKGMKVTVTEALKSSAITGAGVFAGAVLGGPPGILIGGAVGTGIAYFTAGNFKPVSEVLQAMDEKQKQILYDKCHDIAAHLDWSDAALALQLIMADAILSKTLLDIVSNHLHEHFNLRVSMID